MESEGLLLNIKDDSKKYFHLFLSGDELSVVLKVFPNPGSDGKVLDFGRRRMSKSDLIDEIFREMSNNGVIYGIDSEAVCGAVENTEGIPIVVARGVRPERGKDACIEWLVPLGPVPEGYEDDAKVNYWERWHIPTVKEGEDIAVIHPPLPGGKGVTVRGRVIEPPPVKKADFVLKKGEVALREDGRTIYALRIGRPVVDDYFGEIGISSMYFHNGDVDTNSGNLKFDGDIIISGDVGEGMEVLASGNIEIRGNAYFSTIKAGRNIIVDGSLVNCDATAGKSPLYENWKDLLRLLRSDFERLHERVQYIVDFHVTSAVKMRKTQEIDHTLTDIWATLEKIGRMMENACNGRKNEMQLLVSRVRRLLENPVPTVLQSADEIRNIIAMIAAIQKLYAVRSMDACYIATGWVQDSRLFAAGNIFIKNYRGCYNSRLEATQNISVPGIVHNSQLTAQGKIIVGEAGSPMLGEEVYIIGSEKSVVRIKKAHPTVTVILGSRRYIVNKPKDYFSLFYDSTTGFIIEEHF